MKQLTSLFLALLTLTATAQINYPFNPDENADAFISTPDLMEFLVVFGYEWEQEEIQVDSIPLSMYLSSLEAMIEASALPEGTNPGQFLQWNGEAWELVMPKVGCTLPEACNYDPTAHVLFEDVCILQDECGVCDGPGAVYDCGCSDIPEGECDCEGNVVDALGACGGTCEADEDGDGICDDGDSCVGEADECGVCNGPGAIYGCGCSDVPEGACDCAGNVEDILGVCGGGCTADEDGDGICDDEDDCVGEYDGCGVCNGPGPVLGCGCNDIPEGYCDCNGNVLDAVGTCGGACQNDINGDGICDDDSIPGCTYDNACNYDPSASINDGSCDFTSCYGCTDIEACNYSPEATIDNGVCWYVEEFYLNCEGDCESDVDGDGVCDQLEVYGCTDPGACNFASGATEENGTCDYCSCADVETLGCTNPDACNFNEEANCDDSSCEYSDECEVCGGTGTLGCTNPLASNYDAIAACDDGSCVVYGCTVDLACNYEPTANVEDESCEFGSCPGCNDPLAYNYNPTSTNAEICAFCGDSFVYAGSTYTTELVGDQCWMVENLRYLPFVTPDNHGSCYGEYISVGGYQGTDVQEALSVLSGTDGALYSGPAANNLELCPNGFHVPTNAEWDLFVNAGGTVIEQSGANAIYCGFGGEIWDDEYYWSSSSEGQLWQFIGGQYGGWNDCCYLEYQMLIKCVSD